MLLASSDSPIGIDLKSAIGYDVLAAKHIDTVSTSVNVNRVKGYIFKTQFMSNILYAGHETLQSNIIPAVILPRLICWNVQILYSFINTSTGDVLR